MDMEDAHHAGVDNNAAPTTGAKSDGDEQVNRDTGGSEHTVQKRFTEGHQRGSRPTTSWSAAIGDEAQAKRKGRPDGKRKAAKLTVDEMRDEDISDAGLLDGRMACSTEPKLSGTGDWLLRELAATAAAMAETAVPDAAATRGTRATVTAPKPRSAATEPETRAVDHEARVAVAAGTAPISTSDGDEAPRESGLVGRLPRGDGSLADGARTAAAEFAPGSGMSIGVKRTMDQVEAKTDSNQGQVGAGYGAKQRLERAKIASRYPATVQENDVVAEPALIGPRGEEASAQRSLRKIPPAKGRVPPAELKRPGGNASASPPVAVDGRGSGGADMSGWQALSIAETPACLPKATRPGAAAGNGAESVDGGRRNIKHPRAMMSGARSRDNGEIDHDENGDALGPGWKEESGVKGSMAAAGHPKGIEEPTARPRPRGRPRKVVMRGKEATMTGEGQRKATNEGETVRPRSRGRPRKVAIPEKEATTTGGGKRMDERGGDRQNSEDTTVLPRSGGRPRKVVTPGKVATLTGEGQRKTINEGGGDPQNGEEETVRPRSRGRPRKVATPEEEATKNGEGKRMNEGGDDRQNSEDKTVLPRSRGRPRKVNAAAARYTSPQTVAGASADEMDGVSRAEDGRGVVRKLRKLRNSYGGAPAQTDRQSSSIPTTTSSFSPVTTSSGSSVPTSSIDSRDERKRKRSLVREFTIVARISSNPGRSSGTTSSIKGPQKQIHPTTVDNSQRKEQRGRDAERDPGAEITHVSTASGSTRSKSARRRMVGPAVGAGGDLQESDGRSNALEARGKKTGKKVTNGRGGGSGQLKGSAGGENDGVARATLFGLSRQQNTAIEVQWDTDVQAGRNVEQVFLIVLLIAAYD